MLEHVSTVLTTFSIIARGASHPKAALGWALMQNKRYAHMGADDEHESRREWQLCTWAYFRSAVTLKRSPKYSYATSFCIPTYSGFAVDWKEWQALLQLLGASPPRDHSTIRQTARRPMWQLCGALLHATDDNSYIILYYCHI